MPQAPSPPTTQEKPLTHPITTMELPPQHCTTPDCNGFRDLPREWAVHNGTLRWDEITPGLQASRLHSITEPDTMWHYGQAATTSSLQSKAMPQSHPRRETP